jgi:SMODS and SLOG-associating 2TM effector domain 1/Protein of unknown function (DUF4231)
MTPWEEMASRQGVWSVTADNLKRNLARARWVTFCLSVLGALLAAIASQIPSKAPRFYIAIGSALLLAVVSFLTGRLMGSEHISAWVRARAASEALKREAFKFAARAAPYDESAYRVQRLNEERERIERDVDDILDRAVASGPGRTPTKDVTPDEYVRTRVRNQAEHFYEPKAEAYRRAAVRLRRVEFGLSLAATVVTAIVAVAGRDPTGLHFDFIALTAVLTTVAGAILAHIEASRYEFLVTSYRAAARRLRNELASMVQIPAAPSPEWSAFVTRCETIISEENNNWIAKWSKPAGK